MKPKVLRMTLTIAIAAALPQMVWADAADPDQATAKAGTATNEAQAAAQTSTLSLEGIVVTGTATSTGVKKLDASYQITAADLE